MKINQQMNNKFTPFKVQFENPSYFKVVYQKRKTFIILQNLSSHFHHQITNSCFTPSSINQIQFLKILQINQAQTINQVPYQAILKKIPQSTILSNQQSMNDNSVKLLAINPLRPLQYPQIDIEPVFIQYWFAILVIILINVFILYQYCQEVYKIYQQNHLQNNVHDVYDKIILCLSIKYIFINIICIMYFHDITNPSIQIIKLFWIYCLTVVFMKFDIKQILWPSLYLFAAITIIAIIGIQIWQVFPIFKIILMQSAIIIYIGTTQTLKINKILNSYQKSKNSQLSIETLLQKDKTKRNIHQYDQFTMGLQLEKQIISHLQNRRSFCIVMTINFIINIVLYLNLSAGKELLGQVLLSLILHSLSLYVVFWYLKKNIQQKSQRNQLERSQISKNFNQMSSKRSSKIVIEMVDLKK